MTSFIIYNRSLYFYLIYDFILFVYKLPLLNKINEGNFLTAYCC